MAQSTRNNDYRKTGICAECHRETKILARGMCGGCYRDWYYSKHAIVQECVQCGQSFTARRRGQKVCSKTCHARRANGCQPCGKKVVRSPRQWIPTPPTTVIRGTWFCAGRCIVCGELFVAETLRSTCSDRCMGVAQARRRRGKKQRRRARLSAAIVDRVRAEDIFARDHWTCQACGIRVHPWHGTWSPKLATLDHIVALANGGNHTSENLQCLCSMCNSTKRDQAASLIST